MKTNLAFALDTTATVEDVGARTLDPVQLDELLCMTSAQAGARPRTRTGRARRKLVPLQDNHSGMFPAFRVR